MLLAILLTAQVNADTVYLSDPNSATILKFDASGTPSIFANVRGALGLAFDVTGNLFVVAQGTSNPVILKLDATGNASVFVSSGLQLPTGLAIDRYGNLYVSDWSAQTITRYDQAGVGSIFASGLHGPNGLAFDRDGNLFVANQSDNTIVKIRPDGSSSLFASTLMEHPFALAFDRLGRLYVSDGNGQDDLTNDHIAVFDRNGNASVFATGMTVGRGLAFDSHSFLYAADFSHTPLTRFDADGNRFSVAPDAPYAPTFMAIKPDFTSPQIVRTEMVEGAARITFMSKAGEGYVLEWTNALAAGVWNTVTGAGEISGTGGPISIDDSEVTATSGITTRFYRIKTAP